MILVTIATVVIFMWSNSHPSVVSGSLYAATGLKMAPIPIHHVIARPVRKPATAPLVNGRIMTENIVRHRFPGKFLYEFCKKVHKV